MLLCPTLPCTYVRIGLIFRVNVHGAWLVAAPVGALEGEVEGLGNPIPAWIHPLDVPDLETMKSLNIRIPRWYLFQTKDHKLSFL